MAPHTKYLPLSSCRDVIKTHMNLVWSDSKKHIKSAKYQEFRGAMIQSALDDIQTLLKPAEGLFCIWIKFMGLILGKLGPGQSGPAKLGPRQLAPGPTVHFLGWIIGPRGPICLEAWVEMSRSAPDGIPPLLKPAEWGSGQRPASIIQQQHQRPPLVPVTLAELSLWISRHCVNFANFVNQDLNVVKRFKLNLCWLHIVCH